MLFDKPSVDHEDGSREREQNIDILGNPFSSTSPQPPRTPGILHVAGSLASLLYDIITYTTSDHAQPGNQADMVKRLNFYTRWKSWKSALPEFFREDVNRTPQTGSLAIYASEVVLAIFHQVAAGTTIPDDGDITTVKKLYIHEYKTLVPIISKYLRFFPPNDPMVVRGLYLGAAALIPFLDDDTAAWKDDELVSGTDEDSDHLSYGSNSLTTAPESIEEVHELFTAGISKMRICLGGFQVITTLLLQGIQAIAWSMKKPIPAAATDHFRGLPTLEVDDIPLSIAPPQQKEILDSLMDEDDVRETASLDGSARNTRNGLQRAKIGIELSAIISRWAVLSVN
jgi:hypothetical protein